MSGFGWILTVNKGESDNVESRGVDNLEQGQLLVYCIKSLQEIQERILAYAAIA